LLKLTYEPAILADRVLKLFLRPSNSPLGGTLPSLPIGLLYAFLF